MALLDLCYRQGYSFVVAHVNYHVRNSADRDEAIVRDYCEEHHISLEIFSPEERCTSNFEAWARKMRYEFFKEAVKECNLDAVVTAHHRDDHLETYLLQKERKSVPLYWGIAQESVYEGSLRVLHPLLPFDKNELKAYCEAHGVRYGEDETNLDTSLRRNHIRHDVLADMDEEKKQGLLHMIEAENTQMALFREKVKEASERCFDPFVLEAYAKEEENMRLEMLRSYLLQHGIDARHFSLLRLKETDHKLMEGKNFHQEFSGQLLTLDYGVLDIMRKPEEYAYQLNATQRLQTPYFSLEESGEVIEGVTVSEEDFPLLIRNAKAGDAIRMRFGTKSVNRFFIDRRIPYVKRLLWPVVVNSKNEVIFVSGLGCDVYHYSNNPNLFVIKY